MKILIVGGGIGGLAAAGFMERKGMDVTLIERAPEFKHIGFGISVFPNGRRLLQELGIDQEVAAKGYEMPWLELVDIRGRILGHKVHLSDFLRLGDKPVITVERATLHSALVKNLQTTKILLGTTVKKLQNEKDKIHVDLSDGTKHTFDLLVAADGIHSQIREDIFGKHQSIFYGWSLRFFWLPPHIPVAQGSICLSKEGTTMAMYPLGKKCCVGIYEYNPKRIDHPKLSIDAFLPYMTKHGWTQKDIEDLVKEANEGHQYYDHLRKVPPGPWYKKRVVLLGDARHGFSPITGMGGSMAIEDGFVLADELAKIEPGAIDLALTNYAKRRDQRLVNTRALSKFSERFYFIKSPIAKFIRDSMVRFLPQSLIINKMKQILSDTL